MSNIVVERNIFDPGINASATSIRRDIDPLPAYNWDRAVMNNEQTPDAPTENLLKIFDWCFKCHIEIKISRRHRDVVVSFNHDDHRIDRAFPRMSDFYEYMRCNYREIFSTLRCHPLILG